MDNQIELIYDFTTRLQSISGRNDKESFIKQHKDNEVVKSYLKCVLDPMVTFGIQKKKLDKHIGESYVDKPFQSIFECFEYLKENNTGRDSDVKLVASYINSQDEKYRDFLIESITKSIKLGVSPKTLDGIYGEPLFGLFEIQRGKS